MLSLAARQKNKELKRAKGPRGWRLSMGANREADGHVSFRVWAPLAETMEVKVLEKDRTALYPLVRQPDGVFSGEFSGFPREFHYLYRFDGKERPDPVSRWQPQGVHGPSAIVDPEDFTWTDRRWKEFDLAQAIIYELHIGTFTPAGTFEAAIQKLPYLKKLGVTCVEVMPIAQFPGTRNWGYDGVGLYAVQSSYGGPHGFKKFVNACHAHGLGVCLDVVYNHFGPEGNYLHDFGPYFTDAYKTPWGSALNYDGPHSDPVRRFMTENALFWFSEYHVDGLRLDAIHSIYDFSAVNILAEIKQAAGRFAAETKRAATVIAESALNDPRVVSPVERGGYNLDSAWNDDFHHSVHTLLTGEREGYYEDYGRMADLAKVFREAFVLDGVYSRFRKRRHGGPAAHVPLEKFVVAVQNHDQVGNRAYGERLSALVNFESLKLAASLLLLAPYVPMLWMGEEYGEKAPFQYFIDHGDPALVEAVRRGRSREFEAFSGSEVPDPKAEATFQASKLRWKTQAQPPHAFLLALYTDLIRLRRSLGLVDKLQRRDVLVDFSEDEKWLFVHYKRARAAAYFSFSAEEKRVKLPARPSKLLLHTQDKKYGGPGRGLDFGKSGLRSAFTGALVFRTQR